MMWMHIVAVFILVALIVYAVTGGADFGGGVWDLFASGPRAQQQRTLIEDAIGPIWEANHVWLIIVVVLLFVGFPDAFYAIMVALQLPLFFLILGIVFRGSSYIFRAYGRKTESGMKLWSRVFAVSSLLTPIALGISFGAVLSGDILTEGDARYLPENYIDSWLQPYPMWMGLFVVTLFSYLAAVYLSSEAPKGPLQEDFRKRALLASAAMGIVAFACLFAARTGAPFVYDGLLHQPWSWPFQGLTAALALATIFFVWTRRFAWARLTAAAHVAWMILGWALAQYPYIVPESLTFEDAATYPSVLRPVAIALIAGLFLLVPSFVYLYVLFKGPMAQRTSNDANPPNA